MGRKTNAFFKDGLIVNRVTSNSVLIKAGVGFQEIDTGTKEPIRKPIIHIADSVQAIDTPDSSNPRIDIIVVKAELVDKESESRKFKEEFTDTINTQNFVISKDWESVILYVAGTAAASPVKPPVPAGYVEICELDVQASTGIPVNGVTDSRSLLPTAVALNDTGSSEYDAIVGQIGIDQGANYSDLKSALDNAQDGWKILVLRNETINTVPVVTNNKIEIVFKRGVTLTKGSTNIGIQIDGEDCRISNARLKDFSTAGDFGIKVSLTALRAYLDAPRFNNCDGNIEDLADETFINVEYTE